MLFKKKCEHCSRKIEKGQEITVEVQVPEHKNPKKRHFCSEQHLQEHQFYMENIFRKTSLCRNCP